MALTMSAVSGSGWGFNLGLSGVGAWLDGHHMRVSGPGFGLIRKCVVSVCGTERLVRAEALDAEDPWLYFLG